VSAGIRNMLLNCVKKRAVLVVLCAGAAAMAIFGVAFAAGATSVDTTKPELVTALLPDYSTFDHTAKEWIFTAVPLQIASGNWQVRLKEAVIRETGMSLEHSEQEWSDALAIGATAGEAKELENTFALRRRNLQEQITAAEQSGLERDLQRAYDRIRARDPQGRSVFGIRLPAPQVVPGEPYLLDLTFEAREKAGPADIRTFTVTIQVWPVVLPPPIEDHSTWFRADLHLHSNYSDGAARHLYAVRDVFLAGRGYHIAYMTDHVGVNSTNHLSRSICLCPPRGWCTYYERTHGVVINIPHNPCNAATTWSCYVTNTRRVSVPTGISFFPGVELSAAAIRPPTGVRAEDGEGHALGYGITTFPM